MVEPENKLVCQYDAGTELAIEQRLKALSELGLLEAQTIPVFEEATQTAAHLLEVPICILGFLDLNCHWFKSAVGLSRLGLMNQLAQERQLPRNESFCTQVVEGNQVLAISDTLSNPDTANSILVQRYGIRAYLGAPLIDASGVCLGAIAVMDLEPRTFSLQQMKFLELLARWSMSEFERNQLLKDRQVGKLAVQDDYSPPPVSISPVPLQPETLSLIEVKLKLLEQLTQELRTPLTSILGMANVVGREIYGPLTAKQKEYLEIVQNSGRYLLSLVNEISHLGVMDECTPNLNLTSVDIEMLSQQVLTTLEEAAKRKEQKLRLSLEPAKSRIWILDKDKVKQLLYHLISSMIQAAHSGSFIRVHISHKSNCLNLAISVSHPWLGEGLTPVEPYFGQLSALNDSSYETALGLSHEDLLPSGSDASLDSLTTLETEVVSRDAGGNLPQRYRRQGLRPPQAPGGNSFENGGGEGTSPPLPSHVNVNNFNRSCESLRLLLSKALASLHGGKIDILGTPESGYRYVVSLPELALAQESL
jgi:hypothetical protein